MKKSLVGLVIISILLITGCNTPLADLVPKNQDNSASDLIKVEITFTDDKTLVGYVKALGIEQDKGRVYIGGSSLNYLYDQKGNIVGAYNYQRVLYMKIISEKQP